MSSATAVYHLDELAEGLSEGAKPFVLGAMPCSVQGHLVCIYEDSAYIAADGAAWKLSHASEGAASHARSQLRRRWLSNGVVTVDAINRSPESAAALRRHYRELWAIWPVPQTEDWVSTHPGDTFVVASGDAEAPPVILLHGSGGNSAVWRDDAATWSTTMRVYAVDIPGEPGLSVAARPRSTPTLTSRGSPTCSMLSALTAHPSWAFPFGRLGREHAMRKVLGAELSGTAAGEYVLVIQEHFRPRTERVPIFTDIELARIAAPTLVVVGQNDALLDSVETKQRLEQHAPHATVILIPNSGHLLPAQPTAYMHLSPTRSAEPDFAEAR